MSDKPWGTVAAPVRSAPTRLPTSFPGSTPIIEIPGRFLLYTKGAALILALALIAGGVIVSDAYFAAQTTREMVTRGMSSVRIDDTRSRQIEFGARISADDANGLRTK